MEPVETTENIANAELPECSKNDSKQLENSETVSVGSSGTSTSVKRGRELSNTWSLFTDDSNPHMKKSSVCRNCKVVVTYHKKSEYVQKHLNHCKAFIKIMMGLEIVDRPEWFDTGKKSKVDSAASSAPVPLPNTQSRQKPMTKYTLPAMQKSLQAKFDDAIALHCYITGSSFQRFEEKHLARAVKMLRPDATIPSRKMLAGPLLDKCYNSLKKTQDSYMNSPSTCVCLITDGWSNIKNEPIVNYMAASPQKTIFLESVATGMQGHTSQWIAEDIERIIEKYPNTTFSGAVTDNTSANKAAWEILQDKHPTMFFHGCVAHGLHLMVKDIFAATKIKKPGEVEPTYPNDYPFEEMLQLAVDCKDLVKFFNNHHAMKTKLKQMQQADKLIALAQPAPTRWGTLQQCLQSILDSESLIHTIVCERNFIAGTQKQKQERQRLKDIVVKDDFVSNLKKALKILQPIDEHIVKFQSDAVPVSEVVTAFNQLPVKFAEMTDTLTSSEIKYLKALAAARFQLIYGNAHGIGYLLDPRFVGDGLPADDRRTLEDTLISIPENDTTVATEERKMILCEQFTKYVIAALRDKNDKSIRFKMLDSKRKTTLQYWQSDGAVWPELQKIAVRVFSMSASSAASERNFSSFGFIHSKLRNCLSEESVEKLVFIKTNYHAFVDSSGSDAQADCEESQESSDDEQDDDAIKNTESSDSDTEQ